MARTSTALPLARRGLRHIALKSRDLKATKAFYTKVLGLNVAFTHRGMLFLETPGGDDILNFIATRHAFDPGAGGFDHIGFVVAAKDWPRVGPRLKAAGVEVVGRRGRRAVYVEDPNGYRIELYSD
jgi:catechol 2,3-dioxygenase-like lactoylglutathione lyase family enzyme